MLGKLIGALGSGIAGIGSSTSYDKAAQAQTVARNDLRQLQSGVDTQRRARVAELHTDFLKRVHREKIEKTPLWKILNEK